MKRIICLLLGLITIIFMFVGCSAKAEHVMFVETEYGDVIRIAFNPPTDDYKMYKYGDMIYFTTSDGINLMTAAISTEMHVQILLMKNTPYEMKIAELETQHGKNHEYLLMTTTDDNPRYGSIGWIVGSNSSFICFSDLTKSSTADLLSAISFSVKSTNQSNKKYVPQCIIDKVYNPTEDEWNALYGENGVLGEPNDLTDTTTSPTESIDSTNSSVIPEINDSTESKIEEAENGK